jgi:DNA polymerase III subunit delta'
MTGLTVNDKGALPLPWLAEALAQALPRAQGHATLVHGHPGDGALELALALAAVWLCEAAESNPPPSRPCGQCPSCHLVRAKLHPDLWLLMPEALRREHAWPLAGDKTEESESSRKPSRQVRIDEVRQALSWITTTPSRGRLKVLVLHPATAMNVHAANALLKTLEEPPGAARLLLVAAEPALLLSTVRSRCQTVRLATPPAEVALAWLKQESPGASGWAPLLAAADGHPQQALAWQAQGLDGQAWQSLPQQVVQGQGLHLPLPLALHALICLAHDLACVAAGASPRYFARSSLPGPAPAPHTPTAERAMQALSTWQAELLALARQREHPWNESLLLEAQADRARQVLRVWTAKANPGSANKRAATLLP